MPRRAHRGAPKRPRGPPERPESFIFVIRGPKSVLFGCARPPRRGPQAPRRGPGAPKEAQQVPQERPEHQKIAPDGPQMAPYGPIWVHMAPYGSICPPPPWGLKRCNLSNFTLASALLASGAMRFGDRKRTIGQLREFVRNNQVTLRARSGDGVLQKLRTRNPDQSFNKPEKRWYTWMRDKCRTAKEKADMAELNALVNYSAGHRK